MKKPILVITAVLAVVVSIVAATYTEHSGVVVRKSITSDLSEDEKQQQKMLFDGDHYYVIALENGDHVNAVLVLSFLASGTDVKVSNYLNGGTYLIK